MKTDVIVISNSGEGMQNALRETEKYAQYREVPRKTALHLRLLTEEMMGMMRSITGEKSGEFWIEDEGDTARLHLRMETVIDYSTKDRLIAASTSGKNEATRTFMGKLRAFFDASGSYPILTAPFMPGAIGDMDVAWSMEDYRLQLQKYREEHREGAEEAWDELEKSVVSNVADEVKVSVEGWNVEMIIYKKIA